MEFELSDRSTHDQDTDGLFVGRAGYLYLSGHPRFGDGSAPVRQVGLHSLVADYKGPETYLDFNEDGALIGIEVIEEDS